MTPGLRIYYTTHHDGRVTATLVRRVSTLFDPPPPAVYAADEDDARRRLLPEVELLVARGEAAIAPYLWTEAFETRTVRVPVHPQTQVGKQAVVGSRTVPLRLTYAYCPLACGAWRIMLPRYDWWIITESLDVAPAVLAHAVAGSLLGEKPRWLYEFRREGPEFVRAWRPEVLRRGRAGVAWRPDPSDRPQLRAIADELIDETARRTLPRIVQGAHNLDTWSELYTADPPISFCLVGAPSGGKTAWVMALAAKVLATRRERGEADHGPDIWRTSAARIMAGMQYLGQWQQRVLDVVEELSWEGDYLYVDHLGDVVREQSGGSIAELLVEPISERKISVIAECTPEELAWCQARAPEFVESMYLLYLPATSASAMPRLIGRYQSGRRGPRLTLDAIHQAVRLLERFERGRAFPGKGVRFVDWIRAQREYDGRTLGPGEAAQAYARFAGLPYELVSDAHAVTPEHIADALAAAVVGQDSACARVAGILARLKAGLNDPDRPVGSVFFVGPTGVGKTELARQLARYLFSDAERMIRLDMSEFMVPGSSRRLLQAGEQVDSLAERVRRQPLSLVLLDEVEKAHAEVFDLLLGVLDEGRLTDERGRLVDFRMTVVVMTSNLGVGGRSAGFAGGAAPAYEAAVRQHFRPEFFNRIDAVIPFSALTPAALARIVDLELDRVRGRQGLLRRSLRLVVTDAAKAELAARGYDPEKGARPLKRTIHEHVVTPIAVAMAQEPGLRGQTLTLGFVAGEFTLER